jgi:hypothetical protein
MGDRKMIRNMSPFMITALLIVAVALMPSAVMSQSYRELDVMFLSN